MDDFVSGMSTSGETRIEPRKPFRKSVQVLLDTAGSLPGKTVDISLSGLSLLVDKPLSAGQTCSIAFDTLFHQKSTQINLEGKIVYCILKGMDGFRTGVRITRLDDQAQRYMRSILQ